MNNTEKILDENNPNSPNRNTCKICGTHIPEFEDYCRECKRLPMATPDLPAEMEGDNKCPRCGKTGEAAKFPHSCKVPTDVCKTCGGTGLCVVCNGDGCILGIHDNTPCENCGSSGECPACTGRKGDGFVKELRELVALTERLLSDNKLGRLYKKVKQACDLIEKLEGEKMTLADMVCKAKNKIIDKFSADLATVESKIADRDKAIELLWQAYNCSFARLHKIGAPIPTDPVHKKLKQILPNFDEIVKERK